jgi:3-dehydroquinate synthetase
LIPADAAARVTRHFKACGLPVRVTDMFNAPPDIDRLMTLIAQDKKVKRGKLTFILVRGIGNAFVVNDVDPAEVRGFLAEQLSSSR